MLLAMPIWEAFVRRKRPKGIACEPLCMARRVLPRVQISWSREDLCPCTSNTMEFLRSFNHPITWLKRKRLRVFTFQNGCTWALLKTAVCTHRISIFLCCCTVHILHQLLFVSLCCSTPGCPSLMDLIKEHCQLTGPEFLAYLKQAYTGEDIAKIKEKTKLQSLSSQWMVYRRGMVTASRSRACLTRTRSLDKEPRPHNLRGIVNLVLQSATFKSSAMNEGLRKEPEAKAFYIYITFRNWPYCIYCRCGTHHIQGSAYSWGITWWCSHI